MSINQLHDKFDDGTQEIDLPLSLLLLDEENFRIDEVDQQRAAIFSILQEQREGEKIYNLAKHITTHRRLAPGERLLVIANDMEAPESETGLYIVMEGNRRVTALKLLESPKLIEHEFPKLYRQFAELSSQVPQRLLSSVPCVVLPDRETALEWVEVKHSTNLDGIGLEKWDAAATARFAERRGQYRRWRIALRLLDEAGHDITDIRSGIHKKTTAVERVLGSGAIKEHLGLIFRNNHGDVQFENGDERAGLSLILSLMEAMADPEFKTKTVHDIEDRKAFILQFESLAVKKDSTNGSSGKNNDNSPKPLPESTVTKKRSNQEQQKKQGSNASGKSKTSSPLSGKRPRQRQANRKHLAPIGLGHTYHVLDDALNGLYLEARALLVKELPRAGAIVTRVFLEMSCDSYLDHSKLPLPAYFAERGTKRWSDAKLGEKVEAVLKDLDPNKNNEAFDLIRKGLGSKDWIHSINTLHSFVHNRLVNITDREVLEIWDRYHPLFHAIHDSIAAKQGK